ncbi:hypothetical protein MAC_02043 [Metarhizium acridum CQMa 102]|uniref:WSC domain-containing protein n=1 Tax=Metarhizium acridum (strain CQMa 102) TaxID=655827 RepID=E9DWP5_METAQ|nr:uncharacterized protein MAC_02043 [Metarhizium acridum CQMa 102]EFY91758.1 hypothetical protein MAC_02043 [Metarhizium acridum CQMa 102]
MSLDLCASSCPSSLFGVYDTDCYCGQRIEPSDSKVNDAQCDKVCPGNKGQICGGKLGLGRRGEVPADQLLSVYGRRNDSPTTALKVVTSTQVITITSCPPVVTDCPIGQKTTKTWTATVAAPPQQGPEEWHKKVMTCYGDYCVSGHDCDECQHTRVVFDGVRYQCETAPDSNSHRLVHCKDDECKYSKCHGDRCNQKVVCWDGQCTPEACYGDECNKKLVCNNGHCEHQPCHGEDCHKMWVCNHGECTAQPGCTGDCVAPPPVKPAPGASPSSGPSSGSGSPGSSRPKGSGSPGSGSTGSGSPGLGSPVWSDSGKPGSSGNSGKPGDSGSPGNKAGTGHVEGPGKAGNGGSASHKEEPNKPGNSGAADHNDRLGEPGNKADAGHDQGPGTSGQKGGSGNVGSSGNVESSGNKGNPASPSNSGSKNRPAGVKTAAQPKNTSPVVAGSSKSAVAFHILAAALGLALMM